MYNNNNYTIPVLFYLIKYKRCFNILGVVRFHETSLSEGTTPEDCDSPDPVPAGTGLLERLVQAVRDSLGTELAPPGSTPGNNGEDQWTATPEEPTGDRAGFLRMVH